MKRGWHRKPKQQRQHQQQGRRRHTNKKPKPFPGFPGPRNRFVAEADPQFSAILDTCYEGFHVDGPETFDSEVHDEARLAFEGLEERGVFRADVTQPFGLGTKCAATYVTRTLVGDPGTTYKYLGLRMFSIPWARRSDGDEGRGRGTNAGVPVYLDRVRRLNDHLSKRARRLLEGTRGSDGEFGSCSFNVALINRMEPSVDRPDLKLEPTFGQDRCSVSWHADSCLEHFSTIAVYHATRPEMDPPDWRIALRVEPDAEGPSAGKLADGRSLEDYRAPPVAVSLPSRSAYFLLDDFNHHHQHAVLAGSSHRWSSTHRVAKQDGHAFDYISGRGLRFGAEGELVLSNRSSRSLYRTIPDIAVSVPFQWELSFRCKTVLKEGHKRTLKQWRTEQLTLSELEFEWIRQFYVQGTAHHDLRSWWHGPMEQLLRLWTLLERKTDVVLKTLRGAAEARLDGERDQQDSKSPGEERERYKKGEKKARQKRAKQRQAVEALGGHAAFVEISEALRDRAEKRRLWEERESDKVFKRLPENARPMPCPLFSKAVAPSPLPETPKNLTALAKTVLDWGNAFKGVDRGAGGVFAATSNSIETVDETVGGGGGTVDDGVDNPEAKENAATGDDDKRDFQDGDVSQVASDSSSSSSSSAALAWATMQRQKQKQQSETVFPPPPSAWETGRFALEVQSPWSKRLISGEKTIETRSYPLPAGLLGRPIEVMESQPGSDGVSALGDTVEAFSTGLSVLGRVIFGRSEAYSSREAWEADESRHLVPPSSVGYGWKGPGSRVYGWTVAKVEVFSKPRAVRPMRRAFRSLFEVDGPRNVADNGNGNDDVEGCFSKSKTRIAQKKSKLKKKRKRKGPAVADVGGVSIESGVCAAAAEGEEETGNGTRTGATSVEEGARGGDSGGRKKKRKKKRRF